MEHVVEILHLFTEPVVTHCENRNIFGSIALSNSVSFLNVFSVLFTYHFYSNTVLINIKLLIKCQNSCQSLNNVHYVLLNIFTMLFLFDEIYCLLFHYQHCLFDNVSLWTGHSLSFHCLQFITVYYILNMLFLNLIFLISMSQPIQNKSFVLQYITTATWEKANMCFFNNTWRQPLDSWTNLLEC